MVSLIVTKSIAGNPMEKNKLILSNMLLSIKKSITDITNLPFF